MNTFGVVIRVIVIVLGFITMYGLWTAFDVRRQLWTAKLFEIWLAQFLFTVAVIEGNVELMYRRVFPTASTFLIGFVFLLVIKTTLGHQLPYVKDYQKSKKDKPV